MIFKITTGAILIISSSIIVALGYLFCGKRKEKHIVESCFDVWDSIMEGGEN
jgi:hypothetical protein